MALIQSSVLKKIKTGSISASSFNISLDDRFLGATPQISGLSLYSILYTYKCNLQLFNSAATFCGNASWYADYNEVGGAMSYPGGGVRDLTQQGVIASVYNSTTGVVPYFNISLNTSYSLNYILYVDGFVSFFN